MPTIPAPKEQSVMPDGSLPYQSVNTSPATFGAGLAQGMDQASDAQYQMLQQNQQIKVETDNTNALNKYMKGAQDLENGNQDQGIIGYRTLMGQNAIDALPTYQQKLEDLRQSIRSDMSPAEARMFDQSAFRIQRGTMDSMGSYSAQQQRVALHDAAKARLAIAQQAAVNDADDPTAWAHHLGEVLDASNQMSRAAGQYGDAADMNQRQALSAVYEARVKQLIDRGDTQQASDFFTANRNSMDPFQRDALGKQVQTTYTAQQAKTLGSQAYLATIGQPSAPALPDNKNAPDLKPYDQTRLDQISKFVKGSTPWDDTIAAAAKQYNVNPNEIKLKIAIESGGDPKIVNPQSGTTGLGQFTADTAKRYGITDRTDPVQSINGIAKMLAANGGTVGGDLSGADRAYYGGSRNARGPNTDQYVENTRAARQAVMGGGAPAPLSIVDMEGKEAEVIKNAQAVAESQKPGNIAFRDQVVGEARRAWSLDLQGLKGQEYSNYSNLLPYSVGDNAARSLSDLPPAAQRTFALLTPEHQASLQTIWQRNQTRDDKAITPDDTRKMLELTGQSVSDPLAFKSRDIASDIADLPKPYQNAVLSQYMKIDKAEAQGVSYTKALTNANVVHMLESAKIKIPTAGAKGDFSDYNQFAGRMKESLDQFFTQNKRNPTDQELNTMAGSLMQPGKVAGGTFWDTSKRNFQTSDQEQGKFYVPVPGDQKPQLAKSFQQVMGHAPSDQELQSWYTKYKLAGGK